MSKNSSEIPMTRRVAALYLALTTAGSPMVAAAASPTIPGFYGAVPLPNAPASGTLPVLRPGSTPIGATVGSASGNTLTVNQNQSQAVIDWSSFNVAPDSVVVFNQKQNGVAQTGWSALNRIYDANPSLIYGQLKADGRVFLVNRNGILFGPNAQVNAHSLVASNLNITDQNFYNGKLRFTTDRYDAGQGAFDARAFVSNYGSIATDSGGSVFFVGPNVVNAGTIGAPSGKINLIAAGLKGDGSTGEVETAVLTVDATGNDVTYNDQSVAGQSYNAAGGKLVTEGGGRIGMYGDTVQNDGLIRAVTAFKKGGVVALAARNKVATGAGSVIESPIDKSGETADPQFNFAHPEVIVQGLTDASGLHTLSLVEHRGSIVAPSGNVTVNAKDRVYLSEGSGIDVSGLWLDRDASANLLEVQLNSVDLRDDFGQKDGILKGQKIYVDVLDGTSIGNISSAYLTMQSGAEERSTTGGRISLGGPDSTALAEIVFKEGARLDFSGGGIRYATGTMSTSRLVSGNKVYGIGDKNLEWIDFNALADSQTREFSRFGVTETYKGVYFGGGSAVKELTGARLVGSDAGSVVFNARVAALDGTLSGSATRGQYQTAVNSYVSKDFGAADYQNYLVSVRRGREESVGGSVSIGQILPAVPSAATTDNEKDSVTEAIVVKAETAPLGSFEVDTALNRSVTEVSAAMLNEAGLSSVNFFANTSIVTEAGARITLNPGGSYVARGRRIEFAGEIEAAGGTVEMTTRPNVSSYESLLTKPGVTNELYRPLTETIYLAQGSRISTAGERLDNSAAGTAAHPVLAGSHTNGGTILIQERTEEGTSETLGTSSTGHTLAVATGALLDVSGGWLIDAKGNVSGGSAGVLDLKGPTLSLAGEVRGFSLPGQNGGEIRLHAGEVQVSSHDAVLPTNTGIDAPVPDYLLGKLVLGEERLKDTGFTRVSLTAIDDIVFMDGAVLAPSQVKAQMPVPALVAQSSATRNSVVPAGGDSATASYLGATSVTLTAGQNIYESSPLHTGGDSTNNINARIELASGTGITVAPGGSVKVNAPYVDIAGRIEALGGSVEVKGQRSVTVGNGGSILADGYAKPVTATVAGIAAGAVPQDGGSVKLQSALGDVVLQAGSLIDVSAADPVERWVAGKSGAPVQVLAGANPGSLTLSYAGALTLDGAIDGSASVAHGQGGTLSVTRSAGDLTLAEAEVNRYQRDGFDAITFAAANGAIVLPAQLDVSVGRSLTLDAASIRGTEGGDVTLRAPWVTLTSTPSAEKTVSTTAAAAGVGSLRLDAAGFLDVTGSIRLDGFSDVTLAAGRDLRFADLLYQSSYAGDLRTGGDLTLQAARVYPTTLTDFTVTTKGKTTILPGASDPNPVYSAGGKLTIAAAGGIEQRGTLLAPQGTITLVGGTREKVSNTDGSYSFKDTGNADVVLAEGSVTSAAGSVAVAYGSNNGSTWTTRYETLNDGSILNTGDEITAAPDRAVNLTGKDVVVGSGAKVDVSAGGSVFAANFQAGISGTKNPLAASTGRYVILPDRSVTLPGSAVYLDAVPELGLSAGVYSLLPAEQYGFVPGALVVQATGQQMVSGQRLLSREGYRVIAGYKTVTDTSIAAPGYQGYTVRSAADVRNEGDFTDMRRFASENGGNVTLSATSAVMNGDLSGRALQGHQGGILSLAARNVVVQAGASSGALVQDTLVLDSASVSDKGFDELVLGSQAYDGATPADTTVTVKQGTRLEASSVTLKANSSVTVEKDARVAATGAEESGTVTVDVPTGTFALNEGGDVHASHGLAFNVGDMQLNGSFGADNSTLSLAANRIVFAADGVTQASGALYLTDSRWKSFNGYEDLTIKSRSDIEFQNDVNLASAGSLTLDAPTLTGSATSSAITLTAASTLTLTNTGGTPVTAPAAGTTALTLKGDQIVVSPRQLAASQGSLVLDRFASVSLDSAHDIVLSGAGSLKTGGDLALKGARVTTSYYRHDADPSNSSDVAVPYTAAAIALSAAGNVTIAGNGGDAGTNATPGGSLEIAGKSITVGDTAQYPDHPEERKTTLIEASAGAVRLSATGDVVIGDKASIAASGSRTEKPMQPGVYSYGPAGSIALASDAGTVTVAAGSTLDVSASDQGDAGRVELSAAKGGVTLAGTLKGSAADGKGGSFTIDSATLDGVGGLDGLGSTLKGGGFDNTIDIRSRSGNLALNETKSLSGRSVRVAADGGDLTVTGTVNADTADGAGRIELYADHKLTIGDKGGLYVRGTAAGAGGGSVLLSSRDGSDNAKSFDGNYALTVASGSTIDVSPHEETGTGGTISFRAYQGKENTGDLALNDVNMATIGGTVKGASGVTVEAVKGESFSTDTVLKKANLDGYLTAADTFMGSAAAIASRLNRDRAGSVTGVRAGIEVATAAGKSLTVGDSAATGALSLAVRPGGSPAVLTLKSGGDLKIVQSLTDAPTAPGSLYSSTMQKSTALNLVAGSDGGANYLGVARGGGNLSIESGKWVYTENALIRFAAGNDATFAGTPAAPGLMINSNMMYNLGSYGGSVEGTVGRDLVLSSTGSAIQTALGDIDLSVGRNLNLGTAANTGAIRTTGEYQAGLVENVPGVTGDTYAGVTSYWTYHDGGGIRLDVGGSVLGNLKADNGWDGAYKHPGVTLNAQYPWYLAAGFGGKEYNSATGSDVASRVTVGIATMGGGDISIRTGGSLTAQVGLFGTRNESNLEIVTGGDLIGRFRIMDGTATLASFGGFGRESAANPTWRTVIEMADAKVSVAAQGDVVAGTVLNPDNSRERILQLSPSKWHLTYAKDAAAELTSLNGDATLFGSNYYDAYQVATSEIYRKTILPSSFEMAAAGDLKVQTNFYLAPSATGNLRLFAGRDIVGAVKLDELASFRMVDVDIDSYYGWQTGAVKRSEELNNTPMLAVETPPWKTLNHAGDAEPVVVKAGNDIETLKLVVNKEALLSAGGDIRRLDYVGENTGADGITMIYAKKNLDQGFLANNGSGIVLGGPGLLLVEAGDGINLGNSKGIQSIGNRFNSAFTGDNTDSDVIVTAGAKEVLPTAKASSTVSLMADFFEVLKDVGDDYAKLKAEGKNEEAHDRIDDARAEIAKYFKTHVKGDTAGGITMVDSLIRSGKGDLYVLARDGMNVGRSSIGSSGGKKDTGITTTFGGSLDIYTGGNLDVNESRAMTFMGGDIVIWSDQGDINAGRGSKTALSSPEPAKPTYDPVTGVLVSLLAPAPALGSGVRASTYDPDGSTGPLSSPAPGDIYMFAPKGIIDAGEAGIAGGKVTLGATQVLNVKNISFSGGAVGVPTGADSAVSLGSLAGNSSLTESTKAMEAASGLGAAKDRAPLQSAASDDFMGRWLDLRIVSFDELPDGSGPLTEEERRERAKQKEKK